MEKIKILVGRYSQESGLKIVRAYNESDYENADKDLEMVSDIDQLGMNWSLIECELFSRRSPENVLSNGG